MILEFQRNGITGHTPSSKTKHWESGGISSAHMGQQEEKMSEIFPVRPKLQLEKQVMPLWTAIFILIKSKSAN